MKKCLYLILVFCTVFAIILTSCSDSGKPSPLTPEKITIMFNTGGGSTVAEIEIDENTSLPTEYLTGNKVPTLANNRFDGWLNGTTPVTKTTKFTQNTTLTAKWVLQVTVIFYLGDGVEGTPPASVTIDAGTNLVGKFPSKAPSREGHDFEGWYNGDIKYIATTTITTTSTTFTLTAKWELSEGYVVQNAQSPAIHPGNHFVEIVTGGVISDAKVNVDFTANGLFANVEPGAGVLSSQWYRSLTENGEGETIALTQTSAGSSTLNEISLPFKWKESVAGTYW